MVDGRITETINNSSIDDKPSNLSLNLILIIYCRTTRLSASEKLVLYFVLKLSFKTEHFLRLFIRVGLSSKKIVGSRLLKKPLVQVLAEASQRFTTLDHHLDRP